MRGIWVAIASALVALAIVFHAPPARAQLLSPGPLSHQHVTLEGDQHCGDCHSSGKRVDTNLCLKCHQDLGARISAGQGLHGRQYKGKPCEGCHVEHLGKEARLVRWDPQKLNHAETGWSLDGAHKGPACSKCHSRTNQRGAATYLGAPTDCKGCHKDPHENRFGATCTNCHNDVSWKELNLKSFNHDQARFPLKGAHQKAACAKCHQEPPKYVGLQFSSCTNCHKDVHAGKLGPNCAGCHDENAWKPANMGRGGHPGVSLANGHSSVACRTCHDKGNLVAPSRGSECVSCHRPVHKAPFGRGCAQCHASIAWMGLSRSVGLSAHSRTAYPLTGKHEQTNCAGCHKPSLPRETRYRKLTFAHCADCHTDQHRGEFAAKPGVECAPCHSTAGYRPTLFAVAAHADTKFPLVGKHASAACSACHTGARPHVELRVEKQACADCHQNPHGEQFATEMKQGGCGHCHEPAGWDLPKIDHSTWPLTGAHATAKCESCHKPTPEDRKSGKGASYRGVPRNCSGCHDDVHAGQFRTGEPVIAECDKCHATNLFKIPKFDHANVARWALTGAHAKQSCDKCHAMTKLKDGTEAIRWRLPTSTCGYCHADPHTRAAK
jgi:hypothetical protein